MKIKFKKLEKRTLKRENATQQKGGMDSRTSSENFVRLSPLQCNQSIQQISNERLEHLMVFCSSLYDRVRHPLMKLIFLKESRREIRRNVTETLDCFQRFYRISSLTPDVFQLYSSIPNSIVFDNQ